MNTRSPMIPSSLVFIQPVPSAPSFSLLFAEPSIVDGEQLLSTVPGRDGTIGAPTRYQTGGDGTIKQDDDEDDDE